MSNPNERREVAQNLLDISVSVKEVAAGLLGESKHSDTSGVVERANKLRKLCMNPSSSVKKSGSRQTKKEAGSRLKKDSVVVISVCRMKRNSTDLFKRDGTFIECELHRSDTYSDVVEKISRFLRLEEPMKYCLYRPRGGAVIPAQELEINGVSVMWTLGAYMRVKHAGPEVIQLGIGSTREVCAIKDNFSLQVRYGKIEKGVIRLSKALNREEVSSLLKVPLRLFHPEDHNYIVVHIAEDDEGTPIHEPPQFGLTKLTAYDTLVSKHNPATGLKILFQSPQIMMLHGVDEEASLYCVVNVLSIQINYEWHAPGSMVLPSSPVVYVSAPGIYFCTVTQGDVDVVSQPCEVKFVPVRRKVVAAPRASQSGDESSTSEQDDNSMDSEQSQSVSGGVAGLTSRNILKELSSSGLSFALSELLEATEQKCDGNLLGEGGYGVVYKGLLRHTVVAVKFLTQEGAASLGTSNDTGGMMLERELAALAKFRHPNLVGVMGFSCDPLSAIVYEYVQGGSLYDRLHKNVTKPLQWKERSRILRDTCRGLTYLHSADKPMVHQDIKSQNILIGGDGTGKISDFGFALELPKVHADGRSLFTAKTFARSEGYFPSELTSGKYSAKSDVYSYGVVMLETFCAEKVFTTSRPDPKLVDHLEDELRDVARFSLQQDKSIQKSSQELNSFYHHVIVQCLLRHSRRPTSREVMEMWEGSEIE